MMSRKALLALLGAAPLAPFSRTAQTGPSAKAQLYLGPGRYTVAEGGGIRVSGSGVRIEGCTFENCTVEIVDPADGSVSTPLRPLTPARSYV